jgi:hypothetical protein
MLAVGTARSQATEAQICASNLDLSFTNLSQLLPYASRTLSLSPRPAN